MKYLLILSVGFLLFSCEAQEKKMNEIVSKIKSCNVSLFKGVRMEARDKKNGIYRVPFFTKEIGGTLYRLPNYSYCGCPTNDIKCLEKFTKKEFNTFEFAKANGIENKKEALIYTGKYIDEVIAEYEKIGVKEILSDSKIGECVIFYLDKEHYVSYVYDTDNIYNEYWKSKFIPQNKIAQNWYSNIKKPKSVFGLSFQFLLSNRSFLPLRTPKNKKVFHILRFHSQTIVSQWFTSIFSGKVPKSAFK